MYIYSKRWIKILLIIPSLAFFCMYTFYPLIDSLVKSLYQVPFIQIMHQNSKFVGLDNFNVIFHDEYFIKALQNTLIVLVGELVLMIPLSILFGLFLYSRFKGSELVKLITFTPVILSGIMTGLIWSFILDPGIGLINSFLNAVGLGSFALQWIGGVTLTPYSVAVVETWKNVGFYALLIMAGLKMLPKDTFEAAEIDGASKFQRTLYVTLPLLKESIRIVTVLVIINAINTFQTVVVLTNGGPDKQSNVLATLIYRTEFLEYTAGKGSAMAVVMFVTVMLFTVFTLNRTQKKIED